MAQKKTAAQKDQTATQKVLNDSRKVKTAILQVAGKAMIAAWKDARVQKGQNGGDDEKKPAEPVKPA